MTILMLTILGFWLLTVRWGVLSFVCALAAGYLIQTDKNGAAIEEIMAWFFGLTLFGGVLVLLGLN